MKKKYLFLILGFGLFFSASFFSSCRTGYGCEASEKYQVKTDRHGNLSKERGKSKLFSKNKKSKSKKSNSE